MTNMPVGWRPGRTGLMAAGETADDTSERTSAVTEHPAPLHAAQAAAAAEALQEFLDPLRESRHPAVSNWPRDLADTETTELLRTLRSAIGDLGACVEAIAGKAAYDGPPRQHLRAAGSLTVQASLEILAAQTALGRAGGWRAPQAQSQLSARDFPASISTRHETSEPPPETRAIHPGPRPHGQRSP